MARQSLTLPERLQGRLMAEVLNLLQSAAALGIFSACWAGTIANAAPTFNKDIAPVVWHQCSSCHRPGQAGPFPLLNYSDVSKRAKLIADVTARRYMPPWLPEVGQFHYKGERVLTESEIKLFKEWLDAGTPEGKVSDLPSSPNWADGWVLGKPDLVITVPEPFTVPAEGKDVYRNFVIPIPNTSTQWVEAVEFQPGNRTVAHHAFMRIDPTRLSRDLDAKDPAPGFDGMDSPPSAQSPDGHFLSWQPGKIPIRNPPGLAWTLRPGSDLVLQVHLHPSGKPEPIQSSIAFFFTKTPPTNAPSKISLTTFDLVIPPGVTNFTVKQNFVLPTEVDLLRILPHAHYLARDMQGYALLPDGTRKDFLRIKDWDFNWQGDYELAEPLKLPKGTDLHMEFVYDNSTNNVRNPNNPPKEIRYGQNTTDEMAELWLQVLPPTPAARAALDHGLRPRYIGDIAAYNRNRLRLNPHDGKAHLHLAQALTALKDPDQARVHYASAEEFAPDDDEIQYQLGVLARSENRETEAWGHFQKAVKLNPSNGKANGNIGLMLMERRQASAAKSYFEAALKTDPEDLIALDNLGVIAANQGNLGASESYLQRAVNLSPADKDLQRKLEMIRSAKKARQVPQP